MGYRYAMGDVACCKYCFHHDIIGKTSRFFYRYLVELKKNTVLAQVLYLVDINVTPGLPFIDLTDYGTGQ